MSEETQTPPEDNKKSYPTTDDQEAEAASRIVYGDNPPPNYNARRVTALLAGGALIAGGFLIAQNISNETEHNDRVNTINSAFEHDQNVLKTIQTEARATVDPANIVGLFDVKEGSTVYQLSIDIVKSQSEYQRADQSTEEFINYTILESGKAQEPYDVGHPFVVSRTKIDGKDTLIVQDGLKIQLPTLDASPVVPAVDTH